MQVGFNEKQLSTMSFGAAKNQLKSNLNGRSLSMERECFFEASKFS